MPLRILPRTFCLGLLLATTSGSLAMAQSSQNASFLATTVSLAATGEIQAAPDMATVSLGVHTLASTASAALAANATQMARVLAELAGSGVAAKDIQTTGLTVTPQYVYEQNQPQRLTGYEAAHDVEIAVKDLGRLGATVDAAVGAGADRINGISFSLQEPDAVENLARQKAVRQLREKADLYAAATGYKVSRLVVLTESGAAALPRQPLARFAQSRAVTAQTTVAPGELTVRVDISGIYELSR